jgi:hypothetical protein
VARSDENIFVRVAQESHTVDRFGNRERQRTYNIDEPIRPMGKAMQTTMRRRPSVSAATGVSVLLAMYVAAPVPTVWAQQHGLTAGPETPAPVGTMTLTADGVVFKGAIPTRYVIYVQDGAYVAQAPALRALSGGTVGSASASGVRIASADDNLNGIYVTGRDSRYTLANARIDLSGNGSDDMSGIAAAALVGGGGALTLRHVTITTNGVVSSTASATEHSALKVYDSILIAHGGTLPQGYVRKIGPGMMEPPAPLGISGTARASVTTDHSESYFYHSTIIADGWGALSTDMTNGHVYLEADDCSIRTLNSGYGTYADVGAKVVINRSRMDVASYLGIIAGDGTVLLNHVTGRSRGIGILVHNVHGKTSEVGGIEIDGGKLVTGKAVVLVKSANADITLDRAALASGSGVLIQSVLNDDPNATRVDGQAVAGIRATLRRLAVTGDILHRDPDRTMSIALLGAWLRGAIEHASLSMDAASRWTATANSTISLAGGVSIAQIDAPGGVTIAASVGSDSTLTGSYRLRGGGTLNVTNR